MALRLVCVHVARDALRVGVLDRLVAAARTRVHLDAGLPQRRRAGAGFDAVRQVRQVQCPQLRLSFLLHKIVVRRLVLTLSRAALRPQHIAYCITHCFVTQ